MLVRMREATCGSPMLRLGFMCAVLRKELSFVYAQCAVLTRKELSFEVKYCTYKY